MSIAWDIVQHLQINKIRETANIASNKVGILAGRKDNTNQDVDELPPPFLPLSDLSNNVLRDTTQKANS
jgi:hypothetical protein